MPPDEREDPPIVLEPVDSDLEVDTPESVPEPEKPKGLAEQLAEVDEQGEAEYISPKGVDQMEAEDIEIPDDEKALQEARKRLKEPIFWRSPNGKDVELRPFAYTDQQYWATMKAVNNGGLLDDCLLLVFILKSPKKNLRQQWRKNRWGPPNEQGTRELTKCPLLDKFEDWKDKTFFSVEEAHGKEGSPHNPLSIYVEVFLRVTATKTREVLTDEESGKKTKRPPSGRTSNTST